MSTLTEQRIGSFETKALVAASERKWLVRWADVRGEERVTSLRIACSRLSVSEDNQKSEQAKIEKSPPLTESLEQASLRTSA